MYFLGISDMEHDSAAALLGPAGPVAAIEEDKLVRNPTVGGVPRMAVDLCLRQAGARGEDLSTVAVASRPFHVWLRAERIRLSALAAGSWRLYGTGTLGRLSREANHVRMLRRLFGPQTRLLQLEHHVCHAASAYYPSGFDRALVLTLDESGDLLSGMIALGEGNNLKVLRTLRFPNSLGWVYTQVTELLGFRPRRDEHKTQWLSKEGSPDFLATFRKLFRTDGDGLPVLNQEYFRKEVSGRPAFSPRFYEELKIKDGVPKDDTALRAAIARSAQDALEESVVALAERYRKETKAEHLCLAGGVFLNVLLVGALEKKAGFSQVFVQPAAGNAGSALGAAYLARKQVTGDPGRAMLAHAYLGPEFPSDQIKAVLDNCKIIYRFLHRDEELLGEAAHLLHSGKIVAWYQGRVEFGLRALGNRTILASPFSPFVIENLNRYIKHREDFHPFGLSVPAENASALFDASPNARFMGSIAYLKGSVAGLEQFAFRSNAVRVHTVERDVNPRYWGLLRKFGETAAAPVLVNTSFNLFGEPLVCDPREAVRSLCCSGLDALVMGNFLIVK